MGLGLGLGLGLGSGSGLGLGLGSGSGLGLGLGLPRRGRGVRSLAVRQVGVEARIHVRLYLLWCGVVMHCTSVHARVHSLDVCTQRARASKGGAPRIKGWLGP